MFIATQCPVSNAYNERMAAISREYGAKGVAFVGINSNRQESVEEIAGHASQHGFGFPVLKDVGNVQADHFGALPARHGDELHVLRVVRLLQLVDVFPELLEVRQLAAAMPGGEEHAAGRRHRNLWSRSPARRQAVERYAVSLVACRR